MLIVSMEAFHCKIIVSYPWQGKKDGLFHIYMLFEISVEILSSGYLFVLLNLNIFFKRLKVQSHLLLL